MKAPAPSAGAAAGEPRPRYRDVLAVAGMPRLVTAQCLARTAQQMGSVGLVLFTLARYGSPGLAGLVVFLSLAPGVMVSPFAGALLDRYGRIRLIAADYAVASSVLALIVGLDHAGRLPGALLCVLATVSSLSNPLSNAGTRALFPLIVPRRLWDRANALDSSGYVIAAIVGPSVVGSIFALAGAVTALLVTSAVYAAAAAVVIRVAEPDVRGGGRGLLGDAHDGIAYLLRSRSLRGLALCLSIYNLGGGMVTVALPLLVMRNLGGGSAEVGAFFALLGVGGLAGAIVAGSFDSEGRERQELAGGMVLSAVGLVLVAAGGGVAVVAVGMCLLGVSNGPIDIGLFSLRQRRTHPEWVGRVFAVSMSFNFSGYPIGGAIAGGLADASPGGAFAVAAVFALLGAAAGWWLIPARWEDAEGG